MTPGILVILVGLHGQPVADDIPTMLVTPSPERRVAMQHRAITFMQDYFKHLSSPEVLGHFEQDYAAYVIYFGKKVDRQTVMREKARFMARWPQRHYQPQPQSLHVSCDRFTDICTVTGLVDFDCRSADRHAVSVGVAKFDAAMWIDGDRVRIVGEYSEVIPDS